MAVASHALIPTPRSALFVPGDRPERILKAFAAGADAVIVDLEDAVSVGQKDAARRNAATTLAHEQHAAKTVIRINSLRSGDGLKDLAEVIRPGLDALMIPKLEAAEEIDVLHQQLLELEQQAWTAPGAIKLIPLIESAQGLHRVDEIVTATKATGRLWTIAFGAADYALDLGLEASPDGAELLLPRSRLVLACRVAGVAPPLDTPFLHSLEDEMALHEETLRVRRLGFGGKLCIHPRQVPIVNTAFMPSQDEVERARQILTAFEADPGIGAKKINGVFIDLPIVERARAVLARANHKQPTEESGT